MIRDFGGRGKIVDVHFRNVSAPLPHFVETFPDDGYVDMYQVMKALREVRFAGTAGPLSWNDLPVDSHELVALCAPRPVFISAGATQGDGWVDAKGMFLAAVGAGPVYRLLGQKDLGTTEFPAIETALIDGDVAFRQHGGGHTPAPNWPTFLEFASRYLKGPPSRAAWALGP
jgi:hypothetical protein